MAILVDTGPLYALADRDDAHYQAVSQFLAQNRELLVLPIVVLPEACYLMRRFLGLAVALSLMQSVAKGELRLENINRRDLARISDVLAQYGSSGVDLVDASIVAVAERLGITKLLTIDQRHFRIIRPHHCTAFELLP